MRMRFKPYARPELAAWPYFVDEPQKLRGKWAGFFLDSTKPLYLELGCGKGRFLANSAAEFPQNNYIGIDIKSEVLVVAKRTIQSYFDFKNQTIDNLALTCLNIEKIEQSFSPDDVINRIYINFCNPWYKSGHAKHRLTHPRQLVKYREFLADGGEIYFKTDDDLLFKDSLRYFKFSGFSIEMLTQDLHLNEPSWNVKTEHEKMFSDQGIKIKACIAKKINANLDINSIKHTKHI